MHTVDISTQYFMDDVREAHRLESKVNPKVFVEKYLEKHVVQYANGSILEAGCGPGMFIEVLAKKFTSATITGIDISADRTNQANNKLSGLKNARALQADIYELPFSANSFDLIYSRFLFEYLKEPLKAAKELFKVCKPGGTLIIQDLDSQFTFYPKLSKRFDKTLLKLYNYNGFDPDIGRKLFSVGRSAGFSFTDVDIENYHKIFGKIDDWNKGQWSLKLDIAFKNIKNLFGKDYDVLKTEILNSLQSENTIMFSNVFTFVFKKP